jgi:uncharacterized protein YqjF (DUF2071 family)
MTFVHWAFDPDDVQARLPPEVEVQTYDGVAWVGLTPFLMADFRAPISPALPMLSTFPETNLRTYVLGPDGRDGLWFLSLEARSLPTVLGARAAYGAPYHWADMTLLPGDRLEYRSERRRPEKQSVGHRITVVPQRPTPPEELGLRDHWLTGRWRSYTKVLGRLITVPVEHEPWPLWTAEVTELHETLTTACGLPPPVHDPVVHFSPGVHRVRLGSPRFVAGERVPS